MVGVKVRIDDVEFDEDFKKEKVGI